MGKKDMTTSMKQIIFTDETRATLDFAGGWAKGWAHQGTNATSDSDGSREEKG